MPDQRGKAGNIGDVVKHAILPDLVRAWATAQPMNAPLTYVETHAGFHQYGADDLTRNGRWTGDRKYTLGVLEAFFGEANADVNEGSYLSVLRTHLPNQTYLGSLKLIEEATRAEFGSRLKLLGFDVGQEQVESFARCDQRIQVRAVDGYKGAGGVQGAKLVFVDPFWAEQGEINKVLALCADPNMAAIVWYTFKSEAGPALFKAGFCTAEMKFRRKPPGFGLSGAGMAWRGFPESAVARVRTSYEAIAALFHGRAVACNPVDLEFSVVDRTATA